VQALTSWEDQEDREVVSPGAGHPMALHLMLDPTTSWALEECLDLEPVVVVAVGEVEEDFLPLAPLSLICHPILVPQCILGQDSMPCYLLGVWEVLEEGGHPTLGLACLHSHSTDRVGTLSTAHHYLEVEAHEGPCLPWEEA